MQKQDQSSLSEQLNDQITDLQASFRRYIQPPNPITKKTFDKDLQSSFIKNKRNQRELSRLNHRKRNHDQDEELTLENFYSKEQLVFQKFNNQNQNQRNDITYAASFFTDNAQALNQPKKYIGMISQDVNFTFYSNYESANLFQVYQTGHKQYDLILQNDTNTTGYSQWFDFKICNKHKNAIIKINIINLYKSTSLYQKGMKPLTLSKYEDKKWQRNCFNVKYYENEVPMERQTEKNYHTLTFCYEFKYQADEVQFCHFYPYTSMDCQNLLEVINGSKKVKIKNIGNSALKKTIPLIHIFSDSNSSKAHKSKKAIVFIGRQHSGETQSSFLIEEIVNILQANDNQSEFILQKFDVYICPMINIDGVVLGNYRTNAYGYDLNRYWHSQNLLKMPEIHYFKKFIDNLKKRQTISLIMDLHGHNKKLNSFFFGNPYGKNYMMFPYVASKISEMVKFTSCTFSQEKSEKSSTARAVFGNLLKETAYVYTFEVSFWGYKKNNKVVPFTLDNLKQLSKTLMSTIYKFFMEEIKEEIALKESVFFKEMKKQLNCLNVDYFEKNSGSDSEAQKLTAKQKIERQDLKLKEDNGKQNFKVKNEHLYNKKVQISIQVDLQNEEKLNLKTAEVLIYSNNQSERINKPYIPQFSDLLAYQSKVKSLAIVNHIAGNIPQEGFYVDSYGEKFQKTVKNRSYIDKRLNHTSRKLFLLQNLRIFGTTFVDDYQFQPKIIPGKISVSVQVPEIPNICAKKIAVSNQKEHFLANFVIKNQALNYVLKDRVILQRQKQNNKKIVQARKKNYSMVLSKAQVQSMSSVKKLKGGQNEQPIYKAQSFQKSQSVQKVQPVQKSQSIEKGLKQSSLFIKILKQPLIKIGKFQKGGQPTKIAEGNCSQKSHQKHSIRQKRHSKSYRRQQIQKLPEIQSFTRQRPPQM